MGKEIKKSESVQSLREAVPEEWVLSERGQTAVEMAMTSRNSKYKLYATLPIICRAAACPYAEACFLLDKGMAPEGDRCPLEIATAVDMFHAFCDELDVEEGQYVDLTLVRDLVDIEMQLSRADRVLVTEGEVIQNVAVGVTEKGQVITRPEVHKVLSIKDKLLRRRMEILQLLNATRKDKADNDSSRMDPSVWAAELMARKHALEMEQQKAEKELTIDVAARNVETVEDSEHEE